LAIRRPLVTPSIRRPGPVCAGLAHSSIAAARNQAIASTMVGHTTICLFAARSPQLRYPVSAAGARRGRSGQGRGDDAGNAQG
jgi:hypothetical protein